MINFLTFIEATGRQLMQISQQASFAGTLDSPAIDVRCASGTRIQDAISVLQIIASNLPTNYLHTSLMNRIKLPACMLLN